ncbi:PE family protein [Mycobacterium terramassiliense]|uniref:PE family protein n=1 Tax=Mycobacterium terramassiliense TaxID=1841859 RepID=A0A2U3N8J8_9MYCO|nr:PE family protein [Mycobacterium terramassiliense]SPM27838.1 PE family protein [Mycobacterium terramassiliense]
MSFVTARPEVIASAATDLAGIGSNLSAAHVAAAAPTLAVLPAAADEVSVTIANFFSRHAQHYQAQAGQAAAFQEQFVQHLSAGAGSYAAAEAGNAAALLQPLAAIGGEIQSFLDNALASFSQLLNSLAGFLVPLIREAIAFSTAFFFVFVLPTIEIALNILVSL